MLGFTTVFIIFIHEALIHYPSQTVSISPPAFEVFVYSSIGEISVFLCFVKDCICKGFYFIYFVSLYSTYQKIIWYVPLWLTLLSMTPSYSTNRKIQIITDNPNCPHGSSQPPFSLLLFRVFNQYCFKCKDKFIALLFNIFYY